MITRLNMEKDVYLYNEDEDKIQRNKTQRRQKKIRYLRSNN